LFLSIAVLCRMCDIKEIWKSFVVDTPKLKLGLNFHSTEKKPEIIIPVFTF
jgi:hypothetical protein